MSSRLIIIISLLVSIMIGLGIYNFLETHERKDVIKHGSFHGEARSNPLYAARLFLKRMGIPTETKDSVQGLSAFPTPNTVLMLDTSRATLPPSKLNQLIEWVKSGGHLITKLRIEKNLFRKKKKNKDDDENFSDLDESTDKLQRFLGIKVGKDYYIDDLEDMERSLEQVNDFLGDEISLPDLDKKSDKKLPTIKLKEANKKLTLHDRWFHEIRIDKSKDAITEKIILDGKNYIIRQQVGEGLITLISDMRFIENKEIEHADHAEILWYLVHGKQSIYAGTLPSAVWLIHNDEMPALWEILWKYAWAFILSLLFLLIAWLFKYTRRFGPLIPKYAENRRSLEEHITSSGSFYWKNNNRKMLLEASRNALVNKLARTHSGWSQRNEQEKVQILTEQLEMDKKEDKDQLYKLLFAENSQSLYTNAEAFTQAIRQIEQIRNRI